MSTFGPSLFIIRNFLLKLYIHGKGIVQSPSPVRKKQLTSSVGGKKNSIAVNKERNKRRYGTGAVIKKDNKKNLQNCNQHQVR